MRRTKEPCSQKQEQSCHDYFGRSHRIQLGEYHGCMHHHNCISTNQGEGGCKKIYAIWGSLIGFTLMLNALKILKSSKEEKEVVVELFLVIKS